MREDLSSTAGAQIGFRFGHMHDYNPADLDGRDRRDPGAHWLLA